MSSRKRPLGEVINSSQTPTRYAPSTPHAIRALQERSGARSRSTYIRRTRGYSDTAVRPDSARGILRRFARLTAKGTQKLVATPKTGSGAEKRRSSAWADGKENQRPDTRDWDAGDDADEDGGVGLKRPRLTLDIDDSLEGDVDGMSAGKAYGYDDANEDDSEILVPPTPSVLLDDDDDGPTMTFKSIDFADGRRRSRSSFPRSGAFGGDGDEGLDDDPTILSEMGRRAVSEEPTGRLSRYSFGSIRMSDFGSELEIRRDSDLQRRPIKEKTQSIFDDHVGLDVDEAAPPLLLGEETEQLRDLHHSPTLLLHDESSVNIPPLDESFQLHIPDDEVAVSHLNAEATSKILSAGSTLESLRDDVGDEDLGRLSDPQLGPNQTGQLLPQPAKASVGRRKKLKMTQHGQVVPSLPSSLIKRVAIEAQDRLGNRRPKLGREHVKALEQATEWFFEQVGEDLAAYSDHARRAKRVDTSDMLMLMRRQRVLKGQGELRKAAKELLPKESLKELDLPDEL